MKEFIKKIKAYVSNKENINVVILGILVLIFLIITIVYLIGTKNISSIERKELVTKSTSLSKYIEVIADSESKEIDKYIVYALEYSYNVNSKNKLTTDEIYNFLKENFDIGITKEKIKDIGISPLMVEKNIVYDEEKDVYTMNIVKVNPQQLAETPVVYYKLDKISKSNRKKYVLTYTKYIIEDPYKMLNYYLEENSSSESNEDGKYELFDITILRGYLSGNGKLANIKDMVRDADIQHYAKKDGKLKVTYIVDDGTLKIAKIK